MSAFQASAVSVGTTATELVSGLKGRYQIIVQTAGNTVWLGDSTVTAGEGVLLDPSTSDLSRIVMDVLLDSADALYGITSPSTAEVLVMVNPR